MATSIAGLAVSLFSILVYFDPVRIRRVTSFWMWKRMPMTVPINYGRECLLLVLGVLMELVWEWEGSKCISYRKLTQIYFSSNWEELGLVATLSILVIFLLMFLSVGIKLRQVSRMNEYLLSMGALLFVILQAIINMGVVTGCLPTKECLPVYQLWWLQSDGNFYFVGLVINVMRRKIIHLHSGSGIMKNIVIACGGTGGHLTPGIALAQSLEELGCPTWLFISQKDVDSRLASKYQK